MGIDRVDGYSATVEAFVAQNGSRLRLAKNNHQRVVLSTPSDVTVPAEAEANLIIIIDGDERSRPIILTEGIQPGQSEVPYRDPALGA